MERVEVDADFVVAGNWKLHGELCKKLYTIVHEVSIAIPALESTKPGSSSGLLALSSLRIAVDKAKNLLQYCSECSKLYLALTAECVFTKFEKARCALLESLHQLEETLPEAINTQIPEIAHELENSVFALDQAEKQVGDQVKQIIQNEKKSNGFLDDNELELFRQTILRAGITSSAAALTERRALRRLLERAQAEEDTKKESIASYLLHLMRKYSSHFRSETMDPINSQCSSPSCSFTSISSSIDLHGSLPSLEKLLPRSGSFSLKQIKGLSGSMPLPPEELRCPISLQLMYDPVVIASGQTYERACIEKWFNSGNTTCPKTRKELPQLSMTPNYCIKGLITSWCEQNRVPVPSAPPESPKLKYLRITSLKSSKCLVTNGVSTVLFEDAGAKDGKDDKFKTDVALEKCSSQNSRESTSETCEEEEEVSVEKCSFQNNPVEATPERCERWLRVLNKGSECIDEQREVVEQVRFQLKDDDELRDYVGANGITEPLTCFLKMALSREDVQSQEVGTMALFNLAVSNNRNKQQLLSAGVIPLMEQMIQKPETCEAAVAMYLNLSCLEEAQAIIGSSEVIHVLIRCVQEEGYRSGTCRLDALLTLYNLSLHAPNIPPLLSSGIVQSIHAVLAPSSSSSSSWTDKALAVLINLALTWPGKKEIAANQAIVGDIVFILDNGEAAEQEKAVSCLWMICNGDEGCSQTVLQEGVIPALVSLTANGTGKAKDKAQKLLRLFREQRQRELEQQQPRVQLLELASQAAAQQEQQQQQQEEEEAAAAAEADAGKTAASEQSGEGRRPASRLSRSKSKRLARVITCLIKKWTMKGGGDRCKL
ncbi:U-box domain-containing protein 7-like [Hordeum vulgare subsp. vulgare]|uniref:RING-type E3 ubiquitin transferase n=1 Tax=Hordeum vulgare subsp. vulgare TaxID=112509 RepID=A0A8I6XCX8_HORVV|nr:U-box domain-containing protein 7-like [Hordeum vulgare subsp. vulgare]